MLPLEYARERIQSFLREVGRLRDSDFPYQDSEAALAAIERLFRKCESSLSTFTDKSDPATVQNMCSESLLLIAIYLPLLGFILRSTNVRNSFEVFGPLLRLTRQLLGQKAKLILSSEWLLSPHVYSQITELPGFVLLGLPATESGNPLLIPLAGHELGHTAWNGQGLRATYVPIIEQTISDEVAKREKEYSALFGGSANDLFAKQNVSPAHAWAMKQTEETFCDFMGLRLFAGSFAHAFAYLLSPGINVKRSPLYPNMKRRCTNLELAAKEYGISLPSDYSQWFVDQTSPTSDPKETFLLSLADLAASASLSDVIKRVDGIASRANVPVLSNENIDRILQAFRMFTPASGIGNLIDILNAGWNVYHNGNFWDTAPNVPEDRVSTLNELLLKSIEILEIEELTR